jgi:hypothetical protein
MRLSRMAFGELGGDLRVGLGALAEKIAQKG